MTQDHTSSASALTSQVQTAIARFGTQISLHAHGAEERGEQAYHHVRDALHDLSDDLSGLAKRSYASGARSARRGERAVLHEIEDRPMLALLAAGALGFGIATLINARA